MEIYNAAFETQFSSYKIELPKDHNLFLTYYYQKKTDEALPRLKSEGHTGIITIDSGAHSFFEQIGVSVTGKKDKKGKKAEKDPYVYFKKYLEWAKLHYDEFDYFVELDLQEIVGMQQVREWRRIMQEEGIADKMITVHHTCNDDEDYAELLQTSVSGYIGIEGIRPDHEMLPYNKFLKQAYETGTKVHGFAFTRADLLYDFPFYSVDSSSWTTSIRYGVFQIFKSGRMRSCAPIKNHFLRNAIPMYMHNSFREKSDNKIKLEYSANQYKMLEHFFTELWEYKGIHWEEQIKKIRGHD